MPLLLCGDSDNVQTLLHHFRANQKVKGLNYSQNWWWDFIHLQSHFSNHSLGKPPYLQTFIDLYRSTVRQLQSWHRGALAWALHRPVLSSIQAPGIHKQFTCGFPCLWQLKPMGWLMCQISHLIILFLLAHLHSFMYGYNTTLYYT